MNHMASKHKLMYNGDESTSEKYVWRDMEEGDLKCCYCNKQFDTVAALNAHESWRQLKEPNECDHVVTCK